MLTVKVGTVVPSDTIKSGEGQKGAWAYGEVKAEKGYDKIQVWFNNPEVNKGSDYKVTAITGVTKSARKYTDKDGKEKWADTYSINATVEVCEAAPEGFSRLDEDLPF